jgi:hypothetical protein
MIDPKVQDIVDELVDTIAEANRLLRELHEYNVRPHIEVTSEPVTYLRQLRLRSIQQTVDYYKEDQA